jgi:phosphoglycolate phosphatase
MRGNLFFDLDGTLTDPQEGILGCLRYALAAVGVPPPDDHELASFIGPPLHESLRRILGRGSEHLLPRTLELYRARFSTVGMFENRVYPGIPDGLDALAAAGWQLSVVTSKPVAFALPILEHFQLTRHFLAVHGAELSGERSDKRELIAHVLRTEGIPAARAIMIGDRSHDVVGARANDVRAHGVLWGYGTRDELITAGAAAVHESVSDLVSALTSG